ncbi:MAG TPA: carbon-nitrogen hydrolase family protein [Deinococcales bacterium]|nr:carbon-nitrogen hydrolase family protein [Deinococcales bacterium]
MTVEAAKQGKHGTSLSVAVVQTDPGFDKEANIERTFSLVREAAARGAEFVTIPETFHFRGHSEQRRESAEQIPGPLSRSLGELAGELGIYLLGGSYNEVSPDPEADPRTFNTSLLFGPDGKQLAEYRKIHLFDVTLEGGKEIKESSRNQPGDRAVTADLPFGRVGLTICYDLRFPELYRALAHAGAEILVVPSNFALQTGKDHWEVLLRARAIENGAWVIAPATCGNGGTAFNAYGRSMIIDPWGTVVACAPDGEGVTVATIDIDRVRTTRTSLPSLQHVRPETYEVKDGGGQ